MTHDGYIAEIDLDEDTGLLSGIVLNTRATLHFAGKTKRGLFVIALNLRDGMSSLPRAMNSRLTVASLSTSLLPFLRRGGLGWGVPGQISTAQNALQQPCGVLFKPSHWQQRPPPWPSPPQAGGGKSQSLPLVNLN